MIRPISEPPKQPSWVMERTPGRGEGLRFFAEKLAGLFGAERLRGWTVLDVGGGDGWLRDFLSVREYWCLDPHSYDSPDTFQEGWYYRVVGSAERLDFPDERFDLVVSKQTLVHFDDPARAAREMLRVAYRGVVIRQEFPESPIGWKGHSRVTIDAPDDILEHLSRLGWTTTYDGTDFVSRRDVG